jgi:predicted DNA-binding transcriptional regulator AlpA
MPVMPSLPFDPRIAATAGVSDGAVDSAPNNAPPLAASPNCPDPSAEIVRLLTLIAQKLGKLADRIESGSAEGLRREAASVFCGVSVRKWDQLVENGGAPRGSRMGGDVSVWSRRELSAWLLSGCPGRAEWERRRESVLQKVA